MSRILPTSFLLLSCTISLGQAIRSINYEGINRTKTHYLNQFLSTKPGDRLDSALLDADKQTLANLEMFGNATYRVEKSADGNYHVTFILDELFTLLPIFSFGGIKENFWVQVGGSEINLGGRGNKLVAYYQFYDRHSVATHLTLDRIRQTRWGINLNFIKWSTLEPLFFSERMVEYDYDNYTYGATGIYHFDVRNKLEFGGAYFTEDYQKTDANEISSAPSRVNTRKILGKLTYYRNMVNYHFFYLNGSFVQWNAQTVQSLDGDPQFYISFVDFKKYIRFGAKGNFGSRLRLGLSTNKESPFAPFVLDSYVNIRGVGNRVDRGTGAIILNMEYRHTIWQYKEYAIQVVGFSDTGSWRNPGGNFGDFSNPDNFVLFAGGGLRLIHKQIFNAILRLDYGFNLQNPETNGFVLGIGQYF